MRASASANAAVGGGRLAQAVNSTVAAHSSFRRKTVMSGTFDEPPGGRQLQQSGCAAGFARFPVASNVDIGLLWVSAARIRKR